MDNNNFENTVVEAVPAVEVKPNLIQKIVGFFKNDTKKALIFSGIALAALVVLILLIVLVVDLATNTYKTPVKLMEKYANKQSYYDTYDRQAELSNGFLSSEYKDMAKIYKTTDDYKEGIDDEKEDFKDRIADLKDEYGSNYKYTYKITDKEKLDKDDLKDYRDNLRNMADMYEKQVEESKDFDSEDWEDIADEMGVSKGNAKKYYKILERIRKKYATAKVTDGYKLEVTVTITGSELDEPIESEREITVYKVNGRWIQG